MKLFGSLEDARLSATAWDIPRIPSDTEPTGCQSSDTEPTGCQPSANRPPSIWEFFIFCPGIWPAVFAVASFYYQIIVILIHRHHPYYYYYIFNPRVYSRKDPRSR